jgi:hypothetical protein
MSISGSVRAWGARLALGGCLAVLAVAASAQARSGVHKRTWYTVSLAKLLHPNAQVPPSTNTTTIGSTLFRYAWHGTVGGSYAAQGLTISLIKLNATSCRSMTLSGGATRGNDNAGIPELDYYRENASEVRQRIPVNSTVTEPSVALPSGHAIWIKVHNDEQSVDGGQYSTDANVYLNGSASCYTKTGRA